MLSLANAAESIVLSRQKPASVSAETIGLKGVGFLASSEDDLLRFMGISGVGLDELRERAGEPEVLIAVIDFLLSEDALLTAFCEAESLTPQMVHLAQHRLSGG
jgi:hypothetical protein